MTEHRQQHRQQRKHDLLNDLRWQCEFAYMAGRCSRIRAWCGQLAVEWLYRSREGSRHVVGTGSGPPHML